MMVGMQNTMLILLHVVVSATCLSQDASLKQEVDTLDEGLVVRVSAEVKQVGSDVVLKADIRILNSLRVPVHFGDEDDTPWFQVVYIDVPDLVDIWLAYGKSLAPMIVEPGEVHLETIEVELGESPPGEYLVDFDGNLRDENLPLLSIPAIVRVSAPE